MKKLFALIAIVSVFSACKDETTTPTTTAPAPTTVAFKWNLSEMALENGTVRQQGSPTVLATYSQTSINETGTTTFGTDESYTASMGYDAIVAFDVEGEISKDTTNVPVSTVNATYRYNNSTKKLTIIATNGLETECDVVELTANKLKFKYFSETLQESNGVFIVFSATSVVTLTK